MGRQQVSAWLFRLHRRRGFLVALLSLVGIAYFAWPSFEAWHHLRRGRIELQGYHPDKARFHLDAYLRRRPQDVSAHLLAARAARRLGDYDEAEKHLRQAQRGQREQSEEVVLEWALHHAALGELDRTEAYLLPLTREDSEQGLLACEALAEGYRRTYRVPQALAVLSIWLERRPNNVPALLLRGHLLGQVNSFQRAIPDYQRALEQKPDCEEAQHWLTVCLVESARWDEALPYLEKLYSRHPEEMDVRVHLARCWCHLGQAPRASQMLRAVLAEQPNHALALRSLGETLLQEQQLQQAENWLRRAVAATPHDYRAQWFLYEAFRRQNKAAEAEQQLERAKQVERRWNRFNEITQHEMAMRPHDVALHAELGGLLLDMGNADAGRNWLLSALNRDPRCRPVHEALARYYQLQGEDEKAAHHRRLARVAEEVSTTSPASLKEP